MQATSFKVKDCLHAFENYVEWKKINVPPILTELTSRMIDSGYFYIHGRDRKFRPMIIVILIKKLKDHNYNLQLHESEFQLSLFPNHLYLFLATNL